MNKMIIIAFTFLFLALPIDGKEGPTDKNTNETVSLLEQLV